MFASDFSRFMMPFQGQRSEKCVTKIGKIENRIPFRLVAGQRLRAVSNLNLYIPATILDPPGTPISELIILSNKNSDIGLKEATDIPGKISAIIVSMKVGEEVCLRRSAEVAVDGLEPDGVAFEALD